MERIKAEDFNHNHVTMAMVRVVFDIPYDNNNSQIGAASLYHFLRCGNDYMCKLAGDQDLDYFNSMRSQYINYYNWMVKVWNDLKNGAINQYKVAISMTFRSNNGYGMNDVWDWAWKDITELIEKDDFKQFISRTDFLIPYYGESQYTKTDPESGEAYHRYSTSKRSSGTYRYGGDVSDNLPF